MQLSADSRRSRDLCGRVSQTGVWWAPAGNHPQSSRIHATELLKIWTPCPAVQDLIWTRPSPARLASLLYSIVLCFPLQAAQCSPIKRSLAPFLPLPPSLSHPLTLSLPLSPLSLPLSLPLLHCQSSLFPCLLNCYCL